jgi:hypothetical protein
MKYSKVEGHPSLIRDEKTKAILSTDMNDYENYLRLKKIKEDEVGKIKNLEDDISNIKNDLDEIKNLLKGLINGPK